MKVSAKTEYACKALLELTLQWPLNTPLRVNEIAERQNVPQKFLIHILISLKQSGFVQSVRGKQGGYILTKAPHEIRLGDIITHFEEIRYPSRGRTNRSANQPANRYRSSHVFESIWQEINQTVMNMLTNITFEEICQRYRSLEKIPMYTI